MNQKLAEALENCIQSMEAGASMEECLMRYPDLADELQGLLMAVEKIEFLQVRDITGQQFAQSRLELLAHANELGSQNKRGIEHAVTNRLLRPFIEFFQSIRRASSYVGRLAIALALAVALIALSGGLIISSAKSLPGDSLYPVKLAVENIKVHLAPSSVVREEYEINYRQQRVAEVQRLIALGRQQKISFEGIVISMEGDTWIVSGVLVRVGPETNFTEGMGGTNSIQPGMKIEVEGVTDVYGGVVADEIHLREYQYLGIVEEMGQRFWKISGTSLYISDHTQMDIGIKPGDMVTVLVQSEDNGMYALAILHYTVPTPGSLVPSSIPAHPTLDEEPPANENEEFELEGQVDNINPKYWIVNGENIYFIEATKIDEGIQIGDAVSVIYIVEPNGSYTAIDIEKSEHNDPEEISGEETPQPGADSEGQSVTTVNPTEHEADALSTPSPVYEVTSVPTDDH